MQADPAAAPPSRPPRAHRLRRVVARCLAVTTAVVVLGAYPATSIAAAHLLDRQGTHKPIDYDPHTVGYTYRDVTFWSDADALRLRGWLFRSDHPSGRSLILVHGLRDNRAGDDFPNIAREMLARGYDVLTFDLRSSGTSDGDHFTLGTQEPRDLVGAYRFMRSQGYRPELMSVLGDSMGGATVIEAAPQLGDVAALVTDSAFAELQPVLESHLHDDVPWLPAFTYPGIETAARLFEGIDPSLAPVDVVRHHPERAFLFIQGTADDFVPFAQGEELAAASQNVATRHDWVPGATHVASYRTDPAAYIAALTAFIDSQIAARQAPAVAAPGL